MKNETVIKNKYNIGDKIWRISEGKAVQETILGACAVKPYLEKGEEVYFLYRTEIATSSIISMVLKESEIFNSKEELIASL